VIFQVGNASGIFGLGNDFLDYFWGFFLVSKAQLRKQTPLKL
jgi:hypothetical protein